MVSMMLFWILQGLMDLVLVGLAMSYVIQRRRLLRLEEQLQYALTRLEAGGAGLNTSIPTADSINTPLGSALSTLSERRASPGGGDSLTGLPAAGRYALAQKLLSEGGTLAEVSKRSNISETELVLLRKFSQSLENYEAH